MDFLPDAPLAAPVGGTLSVLAVITVGGNAVKGVDEGGNALTRVLSGRRRSSAGMSADGDHTHDKNHQHPPGDGTYFWRAKVGVTNETLVILPADTPPNPLLKSRPRRKSDEQPKSGGIMNAIKKAIKPERERTGTSPTAAVHTDNAHEDTLSDGDAERESEWPAVVEGQPLHAIAIPLLAIPLDSVHVDKKKDMHVSVAVSSAIAGKAGHIRFEFNKGWIGSSNEADLLYTKIQTGVENAKAQFTAAQLEAAEPVHDHDPAHNPHWRKDVRGKW